MQLKNAAFPNIVLSNSEKNHILLAHFGIPTYFLSVQNEKSFVSQSYLSRP